MANPNFSKAYTADVDIAPYLILKAGASDGSAALATAVTDKLIGVSENVQVAATQVVDVVQGGPANVLLGGTVAAGDYLTTNSSSAAVTAAPDTGDVNNIIGKALVSGVAGDIIPYLTVLSQIVG